MTAVSSEPDLSRYASLEGLRDLWSLRDRLYARRRTPLSETDERAVRWFRHREAAVLPAEQAKAGWQDVTRWRAPATARR